MKVRNSIKFIVLAFVILTVYLESHPKSKIWGLCMPSEYYNEFIQKCDSVSNIEPKFCSWPQDGTCQQPVH